MDRITITLEYQIDGEVGIKERPEFLIIMHFFQESSQSKIRFTKKLPEYLIKIEFGIKMLPVYSPRNE